MNVAPMRGLSSVARGLLMLLAVTAVGGCVAESKWMTAPKFYMVNDSGLSLGIYYVDESKGPISEPPNDTEIDRSSSRHDSPGYEIPDLVERVDFDDDGCIDVSIVAFERNFDDPNRDGRLVDRIPAGTCWEPDAKPVFFLGRNSS